MKVKPRTIAEPGNLANERLVLDVTQDDDIGRYVVFRTISREDGLVSATVRRTYWFPDKAVKKGDVVVMYTKSGTQSEKKNEDNSMSHFFYWGLDAAIWLEQEKAAAVVAYLDDWEMVKLSEKVAKTG